MAHNTQWIAYVGPFSFPWGQPGSRRVYGIARTLADMDFKVVIGSGQWGPDGDFPVEGSPHITYSNIGDLPSPGDSVTRKLFQLFVDSGRKTVAWLDSRSYRPSYVLAYGAGAPMMHRLRKWCRHNDVPLIADVVEWYDGSHMAGGYFGPFHIGAKIAMHYYYPRCDGLIAISEFLEAHFTRRMPRVIRLPPVIDLSEVHARVSNESGTGRQIRLIYAGTPGKKDLLKTVIKGVESVDPLGERIELLVLGPTRDQVQKLLSRKTMPPSVRVAGRVAQTSVSDYLKQADFSILLREPKRFAHAGFPTKFVESLASGTPVIANLTSDIGKHLHDGIEGVVCADHSEQSLVAALCRVSAISATELMNMRAKARERALTSFDYRGYIDELARFLEEVGR